MSDWFMVSVWLENQEQEVHFEIANEDGEQYFFTARGDLVKEHVKIEGSNLIDRFYYAEEDFLALAVSLVDSECLEAEQSYSVNSAQFKKYF